MKNYRIMSILLILILTGMLTSCNRSRSLPVPGEPIPVEVVTLFSYGNVTANDQPVSLGQVLTEGTKVKTGKSSMVDLQSKAPYGSVMMRIESDTQFEVTARNISGKRFVNGQISAGEILVKSATLTKEDEFMLRTPTAVASVRGTSYMVRYGDGKTTVIVQEGMVAVRPSLVIDQFPASVRERSSTMMDILKILQEEEKAIEAGNQITVDDSLTNRIKEKSKAFADALSDPLVASLSGNSETDADTAEKAARAFDSHFKESDAKTLLSTISEMIKENSSEPQSIPPANLEALRSQFDELVPLTEKEIKGEDTAAAVKERNNAHSAVLMKPITRITGKPVQTLVLKNGSRVQGIVLSAGANYVVISPEGRKSYSGAQVDYVEF